MEMTLRKIITNQGLHKKWLNTLSYMEFVGARKIAKVLESQTVTLEELSHFCEESRHSYYFKRLGHRYFDQFPSTFKEDSLIGGKGSKIYFQSLDEAVSQHLKCKQTKLNYYYVTLLVEERAMAVYNIYNQLLDEFDFFFNINSLLKEEQHHLEETEHFLKKIDPQFQLNKQRLSEKENQLFVGLKEQIDLEVFSSDQVPRSAHA